MEFNFLVGLAFFLGIGCGVWPSHGICFYGKCWLSNTRKDELTADTGGGQGLAIGVLNLAIVIPQMIVSLGAGPWDALFGGGNIPAFALASLRAPAASIIAILMLPTLSSYSYKSTGFHFG